MSSSWLPPLPRNRCSVQPSTWQPLSTAAGVPAHLSSAGLRARWPSPAVPTDPQGGHPAAASSAAATPRLPLPLPLQGGWHLGQQRSSATEVTGAPRTFRQLRATSFWWMPRGHRCRSGCWSGAAAPTGTAVRPSRHPVLRQTDACPPADHSTASSSVQERCLSISATIEAPSLNIVHEGFNQAREFPPFAPSCSLPQLRPYLPASHSCRWQDRGFLCRGDGCSDADPGRSPVLHSTHTYTDLCIPSALHNLVFLPYLDSLGHPACILVHCSIPML